MDNCNYTRCPHKEKDKHWANIIICPYCGWIGKKEQLGKYGSCPKCEYENGNGDLFTLKEMLERPNEIYDDVDMQNFLTSLLMTLGLN